MSQRKDRPVILVDITSHRRSKVKEMDDGGGTVGELFIFYTHKHTQKKIYRPGLMYKYTFIDRLYIADQMGSMMDCGLGGK